MAALLSSQVRQLIAENEPRQAAELLYAAFKDKNEQLAKLALVQINHHKRLSDQTAAGILSQAEISAEQSKLNQSLLYLADEQARLFETGAKPQGVSASRFWPWVAGVAGLILALVLGIKWFSGQPSAVESGDFDLEVRLHGPQGEQDLLPGGKVNIRLGDAAPRDPQALDAEGRAWFRELNGKYRRDTIVLTYFPADGRRYNVLAQSAPTAANSQTIRFTLQPLPDSTVVQLALKDKKGALAGARVTIDGKIVVETDEKGFFEATIPKASGAQAHFLIEKNGKRLYEQDLTISAEFKTLPIQ